MRRKTQKTLMIMSVLSVFMLGMLDANNSIENEHCKLRIPYVSMTTTELQIEVERLSTQGDLPFEMGMELMKRWREEKREVN